MSWFHSGRHAAAAPKPLCHQRSTSLRREQVVSAPFALLLLLPDIRYLSYGHRPPSLRPHPRSRRILAHGTDKALLPWPPPRPAQPRRPPKRSSPPPSSRSSRSPAPSSSSCRKKRRPLAPIVDANGAFLARNPNPERGQFSSLQVGLRELLARGYNAAMITPVDCPPLSAASLELLSRIVRARARPRPLGRRSGEQRQARPSAACESRIDRRLPRRARHRQRARSPPRPCAAHRIHPRPRLARERPASTRRRRTHRSDARARKSASATAGCVAPAGSRLQPIRTLLASTAASASIARWLACDDACGSPPTARTSSSLAQLPRLVHGLPAHQLRQRRAARHRGHAALRRESESPQSARPQPSP